MKTAMQEFSEWLKAYEEWLKAYEYELPLELQIKAKELLEKEKEQIIDAHLAGQNANEEINGETEIEYYNQTYNQNK